MGRDLKHLYVDPLVKEIEMRKERVDFQEEMKKIMLNMKTSVDENINKVTCKKEEQTGEMADFKEKVNK